uniref:Uncharacterized protein n=1 Tax=Nothobranchius furzeri TaxID=105023 RepID=A0A8C6P608_NOTFU
MKKLTFDSGLNKVLTKCETSSSSEFDQMKTVRTGWFGRLGDAKKALSRKAKAFSSPLPSSSTPRLFFTAPPPPKRAPSTTLTLRSKSMTAELEELERLDEMLASQESMLHSQPPEADYRAATVKQRPTSRRITPAEISSLFERQGMTLHGGLHPGIERGHIPLLKGMSRTKSFGKMIAHPHCCLAAQRLQVRNSAATFLRGVTCSPHSCVGFLRVLRFPPQITTCPIGYKL